MRDLTKEEILNSLQKNRNKIKKLGVKKLILFGSFARDEQNKESDIDFLVEFKDRDYNIDNHLKLLYLLEEMFNRKIDLVKPHLIRKELKDEILGGVQYVAEI